MISSQENTVWNHPLMSNRIRKLQILLKETELKLRSHIQKLKLINHVPFQVQNHLLQERNSNKVVKT